MEDNWLHSLGRIQSRNTPIILGESQYRIPLYAKVHSRWPQLYLCDFWKQTLSPCGMEVKAKWGKIAYKKVSDQQLRVSIESSCSAMSEELLGIQPALK